MTVGATVGATGHRVRAWPWVVALLVVAPFLAETVASSNTPLPLFPLVLPLFAVVYGCPALLLREAWVRHRLGPVRLVLAGVAYTALNEGVVAATWFKLAPGTGKVLAFTAAQAGHLAGVNWAVAANLVVFHLVYSLVVPVAVVHAATVARRPALADRAWIGRRGVTVCWVLIALVVLGSLTPAATRRVCAGPAAGSCAAGRGAAAALVVVLALVLVLWRRPAHRHARRFLLGSSRAQAAVAFAFGVAFFVSDFGFPLAGLPWVAVATAAVLLVVAVVVLRHWSAGPPVDPHRELVAAAGSLGAGIIATFAAWPVAQPLAAAIAVAGLALVARGLSDRRASGRCLAA